MSIDLALLFVRRGEHERATRLLRDVLRARPADEELQVALSTLERLKPPAIPTGTGPAAVDTQH
jgi:hypothetical protein